MQKIAGWLGFVVITTALVSGCTYFRKQEADQVESTLAAAGFQMKPADSPKREASLAQFPVRKLQMRARNGVVRYFYADPDFCKCLYVGTPEQYARYQQLAIQQQIAQEQIDAAEMNEDAAMDWGMWGPFW